MHAVASVRQFNKSASGTLIKIVKLSGSRCAIFMVKYILQNLRSNDGSVVNDGDFATLLII